MEYIDPRTNTTVDTAEVPMAVLMGLVRHLYRSSFAWVRVNGPDAVVRLVRAVRAELFKRHETISHRQRAMLNVLDPPRCRCGKPGTHIVGSSTFCSACGPTAADQCRKSWVTQHWEDRDTAIDAQRAAADAKAKQFRRRPDIARGRRRKA